MKQYHTKPCERPMDIFLSKALSVVVCTIYHYFRKHSSLITDTYLSATIYQQLVRPYGVVILFWRPVKLYDWIDIQILIRQMSRLVGKPTMWFSNRSDTNRAEQAQKMDLESRGIVLSV